MAAERTVKRVTTGIAKLDTLLSGGLVENKVYLIAGEPGAGKTIFCLGFIWEGLKRGESAVYVTIDEKPADIINDAKALGWDLQEYINKKKLAILDISPYLIKAPSILKSRQNEEVDVRRLIADLSKYVRESGAKRLVFDPIVPFIYHSKSNTETQEYIRSLLFSLEDSIGCTVLVSSPIPVGTKKLSMFGTEEFVVSGVILLALSYDGELRRTLFVRKMRQTAVELVRYSFDIVDGRGIVLRNPI